MHYALTDHAFFRKLDQIRIAWPFFLVSSFARTDTSDPFPRRSVSVLTRSEIQGLFADDLELHPVPLGGTQTRHARPAGAVAARLAPDLN
jgi:hypothetical protein